jgi:hypothetical protein
VKISGLDVVEGLVRIYVRSMAGGPGRGLSGANDDDSVVVAVVGWHRGWLVGVQCWRRSRDLRHVGVRGGDRCWPRHGRGTDGEGGNDESRERGVEIAWPVPPRWVRMEGVS